MPKLQSVTIKANISPKTNKIYKNTVIAIDYYTDKLRRLITRLIITDHTKYHNDKTWYDNTGPISRFFCGVTCPIPDWAEYDMHPVPIDEDHTSGIYSDIINQFILNFIESQEFDMDCIESRKAILNFIESRKFMKFNIDSSSMAICSLILELKAFQAAMLDLSISWITISGELYSNIMETTTKSDG